MSTMQDLGLITVLAPQRATSTVTGADVSLVGYVNPGGRQMKAILSAFSAGSDTDETCDVKLQESTTTVSSDFADITGAAFTQVAQETAAALQTIHFQATKKYIRAIATLAGTTPAFDISLGVLAQKRLT